VCESKKNLIEVEKILAARPEIKASFFAVVVNAKACFARGRTKSFDLEHVVREEFVREDPKRLVRRKRLGGKPLHLQLARRRF
jgi:hypothetical protein